MFYSTGTIQKKQKMNYGARAKTNMVPPASAYRVHDDAVEPKSSFLKKLCLQKNRRLLTFSIPQIL